MYPTGSPSTLSEGLSVSSSLSLFPLKTKIIIIVIITTTPRATPPYSIILFLKFFLFSSSIPPKPDSISPKIGEPSSVTLPLSSP